MKNTNIRYFNTHTEGFGYLNGLKEIHPKPGQNFKPFLASTFTLLEGNPASPKKKYFDVQIVGEKLSEFFKGFDQQLNSEIPVFLNLRLADVNADIWGEPGKQKIKWSAKVINVLYMKVGDVEVPLKEPTSSRTLLEKIVQADDNHRAELLQIMKDEAEVEETADEIERRQAKEIKSQPSEDVLVFGFPLVEMLHKDDPQFQVLCDRFKMAGYRWSSTSKVWRKAEVTLSKDNNPDFQRMVQLLKQAGYYWSAEAKAWKHPDFDKKPATGGYNRNQGRNVYQSRASA